MKRYAFAALALTAAFGLVACGDETTTNNYTTTEIEDIVSKKLPDCDKETKGKIYFVTDKEELQICMDGEWITTNGEDGEQGEPGGKGDPGEQGDPGKQGNPGKSCTAKMLKDSTGYKIVCGKDSVGVVLNGKKGEPGNPGNPGENCQMTAFKDKGDTAAMVICKKDTVYLFNGKNADGTTAGGNGSGTGTGTDPYQGGQSSDDQTTLSEGSMPNGLVIIGNQVWAGQNVNDASKGGTCYNNDEEYCETFGRLYTWSEAMDKGRSNNDVSIGIIKKNYQGICPDGYHIPTGTDWENLSKYVNSTKRAAEIRTANDYYDKEDVSGIMLRGTTYDGNDMPIWSTNGGMQAEDTYGFMVVGAGYGELSYDYNEETGENDIPVFKDFNKLLNSTHFWIAAEEPGYEGTYAYDAAFVVSEKAISIDTDSKMYAFSVRCIMNMSAQDYMKTDEYKALFTTAE